MFSVGLNRIFGRLTSFWVVWLVFGWFGWFGWFLVGLGGFWLVWLDSYFRMNVLKELCDIKAICVY